MMTALKDVFRRRKTKNTKLFSLRERLLKKLSAEIPLVKYTDYLDDSDIYSDAKNVIHENIELVSLGPPPDKKGFILPNTVLLAICKNTGRPFCNVDLKNFLDKNGFVVSIGSACNTKNKNASHVLQAIGAPDVIKRGVLRISFGDQNTVGEVDAFVKILIKGIREQCRDI